MPGVTKLHFCENENRMTYPEHLIAPFRSDLTRYGVVETRTPEEVDQSLGPGSGTVMMVVNSVCGCAAGKARPGIGLALAHSVKPDKVATVFAGGDEAAVAHVRHLLSNYPPSSPSIAIFQDGKPVHMIHRSSIERSDPQQIAKLLTDAFDRFCAPQPAAQ
jgi:putative YphP/YqiW family bacilliredoxin